MTYWEMANGAVVGSATFATLGTYNTVIGTGDYNGDGKSDVLIEQSDSRIVQEWQSTSGGPPQVTTLGLVSGDWFPAISPIHSLA